MWAGLALAVALELDSEPARAAEVLRDAAGGAALPRFPAGWRSAGHELLTRCALASGRPEEAARAAAAATAAAQGLPLSGVHAERAAAAVALGRGDADEAAARALAAAAVADELDAVLEAAQARLLAGRALAAAGEPQRAAAELERAAAAFDAHGAERRRDAAERELRRLGHRRAHRRSRPGTADTGIESLTERELQVARLVVDRRTNPQIAAELFLSQKTVETHMRNLFHKLGVSSRVEVARAVERADREGASVSR
jgi:DNA-binding NarL/FixJ family response regulator